QGVSKQDATEPKVLPWDKVYCPFRAYLSKTLQNPRLHLGIKYTAHSGRTKAKRYRTQGFTLGEGILPIQGVSKQNATEAKVLPWDKVYCPFRAYLSKTLQNPRFYLGIRYTALSGRI